MTTLAGTATPAGAVATEAPAPREPSGLWKVTGVSVPGSKRETGQACEDAHAWTVEGDWLVAAVADGAGSASRSAEGASLAASYFVEHFSWSLAEDPVVSAELIVDSFEATRRGLRRLVDGRGGHLADYATTLTIAVVSTDEVWAAQVGDGAVVVRSGDDLVSLAATAKGEFLNETTFLTSKSWRRETSVECRRITPSGVALTTDGLGLLALDMSTGQPHAPFFEPLFAFCETTADGTQGVERFLGSERVASRTDDDLTLLIALHA